MPQEPTDSFSLGASIVLYRMKVQQVMPLVEQLLIQGAQRVYLVDNSEIDFGTFEGWAPPPCVQVIRACTNLGYGRANNLAIRESVTRHHYHLVLNPDVSLANDTLKTLQILMESTPDVGLCTPQVRSPDSTLQHLCKRAPSPIDLAVRRFTPESWFADRRRRFEMRDQSYDSQMEPEFISGCFMLFRSSVLAQIGGFDERFFLYLEDLDLSRRSQKVARNIYCPGTHITHGYQRGHTRSLRLLLYFGASVLRYFNKWGWFEQRWFP